MATTDGKAGNVYYYGIPGHLNLPPLAPQYVSGIPVKDIVTKPKQPSTPTSPGTSVDNRAPQIAPDQRFWSSPARPITYPHAEGLIINFTKMKTINYLALDLPAFPHEMVLRWWDAKTNNWRDFIGPSGGPLRIFIDGSTPAVVGSAAAYQAHQHPSHYGAGHWLHYDLDIQYVTTNKVKLMANRSVGSRKGGPVDPQGKPAAYSLGVRNFDFGVRCRTSEDIPRMARDPDILTERQSFTQTIDLFGCPVELKVRETRAADLLRGGIWKSEPMPVPYAVVNFYVDARDDFGNPQVIDRFDLTPTTSGPNLNLYYATQVPDVDFGASDDPIVFPDVLTAGVAPPIPQSDGLCFKNEPSYLTISNKAVQWDPGQPFWFAIEFQPQWDSTDLTPHVVFDTGAFQLAWNNGAFQLGAGVGTVVMQQFPFTANSRIRAVAVYDGDLLSFYIPESGAVMNAPADFTGMTSNVIRFGAEAGPSTAPVIYTGHFRMNAFLIKQERITFSPDDAGLNVPEPVRLFLDNADVYLDKPQFVRDEDGSTDNAILRYLPRFVCGDVINPYGFVGGPGDIFEDVVWTPVMRDYKLRAGMLQFHPVRAKFFKFEFTCLSMEPYKTYMPMTRTVRTYSQAATVPASNPQLSTQYAQSATSPGITSNIDATMQTIRYADTPQITAASSLDVLPTEAVTARDAGSQQNLDAYGGMYRFQSWQTGGVGPVYPATSKHYYETVKVDCSNECAYFVGLSKIEMYRVDYATDDDTDQYIDLFDDLNNIDPDYLTPELVIGTTNHVTNPSFENGTTGYTLYTAGTLTGGSISTSATAPVLYGANVMSAKATTIGSAPGDQVGFRTSITTLDFAHSINYSAYARKQSGTGTVRLYVEYYTAGAVYIDQTSTTFSPQATLEPAINPNASFEPADGTTGWFPVGNPTLAAVATYAKEGTQSLRITPGGGQAIIGVNTALDTGKQAVTPNTLYQITGSLLCPTGWADIRFVVDWYSADSDAAYISTSFGALTTVPAAATWTDRLDAFTSPSNATHCKIRLRIGSTPTVTDIVYMDAVRMQEITDPWTRCSANWLPPANTASVMVYWWTESVTSGAVDMRFDGHQVENLRLTDYYDGSLPGGQWNGTPNASTSTRTDVDINPWGWDGDRLYTGSSIESATTRSRRFPSLRSVRAVQFASQQSNAVQLVPDPDFTAAHIEDSWLPVGDVITMEKSVDFETTLGNSVKILRSSSINTWSEIAGQFATWASIEASSTDPLLPTYDILEGDASVIGYGGIALRNAVQISESGRVTAAARVYSDHALATPLILQIVSAAGDVLAEAVQEVRAGLVVEWTLDYTLAPVSSAAETWDDILRRNASPLLPDYEDLEEGLWSDLTSTDATQSRQLGIRIVQQGAGEDTWYVDSLALYEDPILWEFSNDDGITWWPALGIRNNPQGVLVFPPPPGGGTKGLRWRVTGYRPGLHVSALDIRPWYTDTVFGIPLREPGVSGGPNIQPTDHYPPITDDPFFKQWSGAIPQDWYYTYRQLLLLDYNLEPVEIIDRPILFVNPFGILVHSVIIPPPPLFLDPYVDLYVDPYGIPNPDA